MAIDITSVSLAISWGQLDGLGLSIRATGISPKLDGDRDNISPIG